MNWRVSSCCCFSLRTGTLILGYLGAISNAILTLILIFAFSSVRQWVEEISKQGNDSPKPEDIDTIVKYVHIFMAVLLVITLLGCLLSVLLLLGVYQENAKFIKIYIIFAIIGCAITALMVVVYLLAAFSNAKLFGNFFSQLIGLAMQVYFTMVIHSYRLQVIEQSAMKRDGSNLPRQF